MTLRGHRPAQEFLPLLRELVAEFDAGGALAPRESPRAGTRDPDLARGHARALAQLDALYDAAEGGWGRPQKYPFAAPVEHAFLRAFVADEVARRERALAALRGHAQPIDPVAGGMFQYSLRGIWSAPHYEKLASIQAGALANFVIARFSDRAHGGFFAQSEDARAVGVFAERQKPAAENARFARLLLTRARREDDPALRALAEQTLAAQLGDEQLARQGRKVSDLLLGLEHATAGYVLLSIVGFEDDPRTRALYDAA